MKDDSRDELLNTLTAALAVQLAAVAPAIPAVYLRGALAAAIAGWSVRRNRNIVRDDWGLQDGSNVMRQSKGEVREGSILEITTAWRPETEDERTVREARMAAYCWDEDDGPPVPGVTMSQILRQSTWWITRVPDRPGATGHAGIALPKLAVRVEDMEHTHRLNLLAWLRKRAKRLHDSESWNFADAPDDVQRSFDNEDPREWLEDTKLIQALVHWTTPYGESPLTWRPMVEAPCGAETVIVVRYQGPDGELTAQVSPSLPYGWVTFPDYDPLMVSDGLGGFDYADPTEWRELRDDELPTPVDSRDLSCEHGPDEHCSDCCGCGLTEGQCGYCNEN